MKQIIKNRGIILTTKDYKDNAKIITILLPTGLVNLLLRGTNKMNSGTKKYTLVPQEVDFMMTNSNTLSTFTEGYIINNFTKIKSEYEKTLVASVIIEKVLAFSNHIDNHELFYEFVKKILEILEMYDYSQVVLNLFEIKLLYLLGIAPNLNHCTKCQKRSGDLMLSLDTGGVCCANCLSNHNYLLNVDETKIFKYLYLIKLEKVDEKFLQIISDSKVNLSSFIDRYYEKYIDFSSKAKKVIKKIV